MEYAECSEALLQETWKSVMWGHIWNIPPYKRKQQKRERGKIYNWEHMNQKKKKYNETAAKGLLGWGSKKYMMNLRQA